MSEWNGKTVLITGASYGIGEAFARQLAAQGANLVLTARSIERLETLAAELRNNHSISVRVIEADLSDYYSPHSIFQQTEGRGLQIDMLVNNAGFGAVGDFADLPLDRQIEMVQVNVMAMVALTHLFLQPMLLRRDGAIIQLASTASFQGVPYSSIYAATKSFALIFSEGLWAECRSLGVRVMALCPGPTATHFQVVAGTASQRDPKKMQTADEVVSAGLKALADGRSHVISGFSNRAMVFIERLAPRSLVTRIATKLYSPFSTRFGRNGQR